MRLLRPLVLAALLVGGGFMVASSTAALAGSPDFQTATPIKHFITVLKENHSFDNYFGTYPGANGLPGSACMPVDPSNPKNHACVKPFALAGRPVTDINHNDATYQIQYDHGRMDGFIFGLRHRNSDKTISMGYYDRSQLSYYWSLARQFVLFDNFFSAAMRGSAQNHVYWVAAAPVTNPIHCTTIVGADTGVLGQSASARLGCASFSNTGYPDTATIFDRLNNAGISWKFYVENYQPGLTFRTLSTYHGTNAEQVMRVPILDIARYADDPAIRSHIVDLSQYYVDLRHGTLPAVAYVAPARASEHSTGSIRPGQLMVREMVQSLMASKEWKSTALMVSFDNSGGWYDHVRPPQIDPYGLGFRVPALLISAYARKGQINHSMLETSSILTFIEHNWHLAPLTGRDAHAGDFLSAFNFAAGPRAASYLATTFGVGDTEPNRAIIYLSYLMGLALAAGIIIWALLGDDPRWDRRIRPRRAVRTAGARESSAP